jgi:predicted phage terminase large subunit-like protein
MKKTQLLQIEEIRKEKARRSLSEYIQQAWHIVEPGVYSHNWHIDALAAHLEAVTRGEIKRLIINIPPRTMKSTSVATMWPTWSWIDRPSLRWLFSSYALNLSIRDAQRSRRILESEWYQERWGNLIQLREDQNAKSYYENTKGGARLSISVGSAATGHGGDIVCCDDPHNAQEADSTVIREATLHWWAETMTSRLNNPRTGAFVVIMQRLHERDLTGFLLEQGGYEHLCLPLEYEPRHIQTNLKWRDENGDKHDHWEDPRSYEGELLWPDRINDSTVITLKRALGSYGYAAQYQQTPSPSGGGIFRKDWFKYCKIGRSGPNIGFFLIEPTGEKFVSQNLLRYFITVDLAASLKEMADYTVVGVWGQTSDNELLLLDITRARLQAHEQQQVIKDKFYTYHAEFIDVEAAGYQLTMVQELVRMGLPVRGYTPVRDKVSRARTASIRYQAGAIYHLNYADWLIDYEKELLAFPTGAHDDQVDVTSRAAEIVTGEVIPQIRSLDPDEEDVRDVRNFERRQILNERKHQDDEWEESGEYELETFI